MKKTFGVFAVVGALLLLMAVAVMFTPMLRAAPAAQDAPAAPDTILGLSQITRSIDLQKIQPAGVLTVGT